MQKNQQKMVKLIFKHPMRNKNITQEMFNEAKKEYFKEIIEEHGKAIAFPNENFMIQLKVESKFNEPLFYLPGQEYEMTEENAEQYLEKHKIVIDPSRQRYISDAKRDLHRFQEKFHYAELVK